MNNIGIPQFSCFEEHGINSFVAVMVNQKFNLIKVLGLCVRIFLDKCFEVFKEIWPGRICLDQKSDVKINMTVELTDKFRPCLSLSTRKTKGGSSTNLQQCYDFLLIC